MTLWAVLCTQEPAYSTHIDSAATIVHVCDVIQGLSAVKLKMECVTFSWAICFLLEASVYPISLPVRGLGSTCLALESIISLSLGQ